MGFWGLPRPTGWSEGAPEDVFTLTKVITVHNSDLGTNWGPASEKGFLKYPRSASPGQDQAGW